MNFETLVFSIPEATVVAWLAYVLSGAKMSFRRVLIIGALVGIISVLVRPLIANYLVNVLLYAFILVITLGLLIKSTFWERLTSVALAISIYTITEFINISLLSIIFQIDPATALFDNFTLRLLWFLPQISIVILMTVLLQMKDISLFAEDDKQA